jgi:hypothetical protein
VFKRLDQRGRKKARGRTGVDAIDLDLGRYEVILEPTAVDRLQLIAVYGLQRQDRQSRLSFMELGRGGGGRVVERHRNASG